MDHPEFLTVPQIAQDEPGIYSNVEEYGDPDDPPYINYEGGGNGDGILEPNLRVASNLFETRPDDLLSIKIENVEVQFNDAATDDESMAVEALRQLGNSTYTTSNKTSPRIETTTPHDLPLLPCSTCELEFRTTADLNNHAEICKHSQYLCPICNETFERKLDLNNHLVCHAVDRPHACRTCGTLFIQKADLQKHMLTHGASTPNQGVVCVVCGQHFTRPSSLTNHMKIHNYQPGRALMNPKMESSDLSDILAANADPSLPPMGKITLPSINSWNLNYDTDIAMDVAETVIINSNSNVKLENALEVNIIEQKEESATASREKSKPYKCTKCSKSFGRQKALMSHLNLHKEMLDDEYKCDKCEQTFSNGNALDKHSQHCCVPNNLPSVTKEPEDEDYDEALKDPLSPPVKSERNPPPPELLKNSNFDVNVYNRIYKHSCTICEKNFTTKQKLFRHMWIHRKKTYTCELCSKTFEQQEQLDSHRLSTHQSGSPYFCPECGKNFSSRQGLWEHNRTHTSEINSFKCTECPRKFTSRQGYLIHKRKHADERPYGCRFCWKAFRDGGTLRKHERIHTGERPHACPICSKAFNQKVVLREHVRWIHTAHIKPDDDGTFGCSLCQEKQADTDALCAHLVKHSDQLAQLAREASKNNIKTKKAAEENNVVKMIKVEALPVAQADDNSDNTNDALVSSEEINFQAGEVQGNYRQTIENEDEDKNDQVECDLCGIIFHSKIDLSEHVKIHI